VSFEERRNVCAVKVTVIFFVKDVQLQGMVMLVERQH